MGITAETGSNYNADDDELAHDNDVDQGHRAKRRKTLHPQVEGSVDMEDSQTGVNVSNTGSPLRVRIIRPASAFHNVASTSNLTLDNGGPIPNPTHAIPAQYTSNLTLDDVGPIPTPTHAIPAPYTAKADHGRPVGLTNGFKIRIPPFARRVSGPIQKSQTWDQSNRSHSESGREPSGHARPRFSAFPESISAATSSSFIPSNSYTGHLRPRLSKKVSVSHGGREATMEEIEELTHAHVAPVVFGKRKFVELPKKTDILAMNLQTLKNAGDQSKIAEFSATSQSHHAWGDVAVPTVSRATQRKQLFKDMFGVERVQVPTYPSFLVSCFYLLHTSCR